MKSKYLITFTGEFPGTNATRLQPSGRPRATLPNRLAAACVCLALATLTLTALFPQPARAVEYLYAPYNQGKMDPQLTGWPLTDEERTYILKPEHERRPGREANQHKPALWPATPSAGNWGGSSWLDTHAKLVEYVQTNKGPVDILLVGDSITQQWGSPLDNKPLNSAWQKHFGQNKTLNIGIGGDKTQNVLWRLDHGGVEGIKPRLIVVLIGNNNMFFTPETGIDAVAQGIKMCVANVRAKFPQADVIAVKVLPCGTPGSAFYEDLKKVNAALDTLNLEADPKVHLLEIGNDFLNADGTVKAELFLQDKIHLSQDAGYGLYAEKLKPMVDAIFSGKSIPKYVPKPVTPAPAATPSPKAAAAKPDSGAIPSSSLRSPAGKLKYPYAPYNEGKMDPQLTGWPLTDAEKVWVLKSEYTRKPGHEAQKHLPDAWFVTPTAAYWESKTDPPENLWVTHHGTLIGKVQAAKDGIDIALLGDSITQGWGGGWDGSPFNAAWQKHFGQRKTVNLGIGGDRMENILWRLDHGALDGASPKVLVLMIGVNNAPLVFANGAPAASAARGIKLCIENLRLCCPLSQIVLMKILPAFDPAKEVGKEVTNINAILDTLKLDHDPKVHVLDLWSDFTNADGTLKAALYSDGHLHLGPEGYETFAGKLRPVVEKLLGGIGK